MGEGTVPVAGISLELRGFVPCAQETPLAFLSLPLVSAADGWLSKDVGAVAGMGGSGSGFRLFQDPEGDLC